MPTFEVLIDDPFSEIVSQSNKHVLSLANDYEDGKWRSSKFHQFIWDNIVETALNARERQSLVNKSASSLASAAQNLRLIDKKNLATEGSELAEIVLYGIMKEYYNALPVVPKIYYKQNVNDNAKGADSVHIVVKDNDYTLWFGEAKLFNGIEDVRFDRIVQSVANMLQTDKLKKENSIITGVSDIGVLIKEASLLKKIKTDLNNRNSIDELKPKINVPILIIHECDITNESTLFDDDYKEKIKSFHKERATSYYNKQILKLKEHIFLYDKITFHLILFPIPNKEIAVKKFLNRAKIEKEANQND